ncbi:hypothetical protein PAERUG_P60_London_6_VIM_2_11_13_06593 [Pseudomonas aeruginosa]|nr:hypothetical protein Q021_05868 [Pseudomonas aeruginosa BWHPSA008]CRQ10829.1 hypothetical protein PAERUG_P43_2_London_9_VIM_2_11_12_02167 [Pseudomonas aeruginosa]CRQ17791.1 hypothetical protein PAERUG_E7_London_9_VIM_2_02_13_05918 [Pseudomonas aeruginosa]CRQ43748.1 hypothetical protein PAERUG_P43_1_London_9_VIM_2_11_12_02323 [Pseudomonas aeruginosa]CRQ61802.1 hypothetical protein PAERUG_P50_London_9_VIM_2_01_13_02316 [Pseudomonas aeruginosa]
MTERRLKCRRCRWIGALSDLRPVPHPKESWRSDNVCPRCGCKTFSPIEDSSHG